MSSISSGTTSTTGYVVSSDTTGALVLKTGSAATTAVTIDTSQNVGIGTGSPSAQLQINKTGTGDYTTFRLANSGASGKTYEIGVGGNTSASGYANNLYFYDSTVAALRMVLDTSGNLGIGTGSPADSSSFGRAVDAQGTNGAAYYARATSGGSFAAFGQFNTGGGTTYIQNNGTGPILIYTNSGGGLTERMRLTAAGFVGIGTSSPSCSLDVQKSAGANFVATFQNTTAATPYCVFIKDAASSTAGYPLLAVTDSTGASTYLRVDSSNGNVGIGTTPSSYKLDVSNTSATLVRFQSTNANGAYLDFSNGSNTPLFVGFGPTLVSGLATTDAGLRYSNNLVFSSGATEAARFIAGGQLCIGKTTTAFGTTGIYFNSTGQGLYTTSSYADAGGGAIYLNRLGVDGTIQLFYKDTTNVGNIAVTTSATAYNTSSDYRLKNSIAPLTGALAKVAQLKPVTYKWNADGLNGEGFIAHELAEVCPQAVTGEKDAVETYTDDDGNEQTRPAYQGIDVSFLVATLTAAIQEQQLLIQQLQADVAILKGGQQ